MLLEVKRNGQSPHQVKSLTAKLNALTEKTLKIQEKVNLLRREQEDVLLNLSQADIKNLKEDLSKVEKEIAKIIRKTQIDIAAEIG